MADCSDSCPTDRTLQVCARSVPAAQRRPLAASLGDRVGRNYIERQTLNSSSSSGSGGGGSGSEVVDEYMRRHAAGVFQYASVLVAA